MNPMSTWDRFVETFFNARVMAKYLPDILEGTVLTIELALLVVLSGILAGLVLALIRSLAIRPVNFLIVFVVDLFRSLPPLVVIVLIYFGLPSAAFSPSAFVSTWLSLALIAGVAGAVALVGGDVFPRVLVSTAVIGATSKYATEPLRRRWRRRRMLPQDSVTR